MPLRVARGVTERFGRIEALVDLDFDVDAGEVVALVGDSSAGKSTLIEAIAGVQPAEAGEYEIEGRRADIRTPTDAARAGIATVDQDLAPCDNLDVVANVHLGHQPATRLGTLDETAVEQRTREPLASLVVTTLDSPRSRVGFRSGGRRRAVPMARSLVTRPRLLRLGRHVATFDRRATTREDVVAAIIGGSVARPVGLLEAVGR